MCPERDGLSGWMGVRKVRPGICLWNGMWFPVERFGGKCDPEFVLGMGCGFPTGLQAEAASHSRHGFWDTLSGYKEGHMTWPSTYIFSRFPHDKPCFNTEASARPARNIRFIASSARAGEHLMCSPCEQDCPSRESYIPRRPGSRTGIQARYLILVVPGARLGSVSLASVWKCSV